MRNAIEWNHLKSECIYKQIHGCATGRHVDPVVANLSMEVIEESAKTTSAVPTIFSVDRTAKKGNNFIAQYFGETKLTFIRGCKS